MSGLMGLDNWEKLCKRAATFSAIDMDGSVAYSADISNGYYERFTMLLRPGTYRFEFRDDAEELLFRSKPMTNKGPSWLMTVTFCELPN